MPNPPQTLPTGTVTFLFTDIEGSTELAQQHPDAMPALLARHHAILREAINASHGVVFKTIGDAFCAAFSSAEDAFRASVAAQNVLQHEAWSPASIKVRMGLHSGIAQPELDGNRLTDYSGYLTLTLVQRIMSAAYGGQTLVSNSSAELLRGHLPKDVALRDMGEHRLKGLTNLERLWQIVAPDLVSDFPALHTLNAVPNNLPVQLTTFIGREKEIKEIKQAIFTSRLVTLIGTGGTGKTRLAFQVATELLDKFSHGVQVIELAPLADPSLIPQTIASVFGVGTVEGRSVMTAVIDFLHDKKLLLILDDCEHLITACAKLTDELLKNCPDIRILASSREAFGINGEMAYHVPSLSLPSQNPTMEDLENCEAARLFIDRATVVNPHFRLTTQNTASIAKICQQLDGIPLALELAAARAKVFSVDQIADRLSDRFRLLTGGSRTALPHQQTLRAAIDWSHDLLPENERILLRRLSVFANGWTFEAAEAVCGSDEFNVLDLLPHLVDKSLVVVDQHGGEDPRFRMLETIRQYARDRLVDAGEIELARNQHAAYFLQMAERVEPNLYASDAIRWMDLLEAEYDNFRAALDWLVESQPESALKLIASLLIFWVGRGYYAEGVGWAEGAVAHTEALPPVAADGALRRKKLIGYALAALVLLSIVQGDNTRAESAAEKGAALAREIGDKTLLAQTFSYLCLGLLSNGDTHLVEERMSEAVGAARAGGDTYTLGITMGITAEAFILLNKEPETRQAYAQEGIAILESNGNAWGQSVILLGLGMAAKYSGHFDEARQKFAVLEPLLRAQGDVHRLKLIRSELAHMQRYEGHLEQAEQLYRETILGWRHIGHRAAVANQLECLAFIAIARHQPERAAGLLGAAEMLREKINIPMNSYERQEYTQHVDELRTGLDKETFAAAWAKGRALSMEQAVDFALQESA